MSDKKVSIQILTGCRCSGKSLTAGKVYSVSESEATAVIGAGRAVIAPPQAKTPAKGESK